MKKWVGLILLLATGALAESYWWNSTPMQSYGVMYMAAATATCVPRVHGGASLSLQNLDVAPVYCGGDAAVTSSNFGLRIASGAQASVPLSYNSLSVGPQADGGTVAGAVCCYSVLGVVNDGGTSGLAHWELQ